MTKIDKLKKRFLSKPKDFKYSELKRLLNHYGYVEKPKGKTSGSRVSYINPTVHNIISLHRPHPAPELKQYQIKEIIKELKRMGFIK